MSSEKPSSPPAITLLTLNCWGLLHISSLRAPRLAEIARQLSLLSPPPDIICLQECWTQSDFSAIAAALRPSLPHAKHFLSGPFGAGLAILSRWPMLRTSMHRYPLNGRPTAVLRGDWYVGKGVACASVRFGPRPADVLEVLNTHTHAPYGSDSEPNSASSYLCHRIAQSWELAKLARAASSQGRLVVALGDFNFLPCSLPHRIVTARSGLADLWRVLHPLSSLGPATHPDEAARGLPVPSAEFNLRVNGATSDGAYNTWRWPARAQRALKSHPCPVDPDSPDPRGKRLDYIFASIGPSSPSTPSRHGWLVKSASVAMTQRHPRLNVSLSDHFAVSATLQYHQSATPASSSSSSSASSATTDLDAHLLPNDSQPLSPAIYDEILAIIASYSSRELSQQHWRGLHFYASLLVWLACLVATWFSPANWLAFLLSLVASLVLVSGIIDGLLALLFFSTELRALREFESEVRTARSLAQQELQST